MGIPIIRPAVPDDAERAVRLLDQLGYPGSTADEVRLRLEKWGSSVLVAELDGVVEGLVAVTSIPLFERDGSVGRVVALVVSDACRGRRVGRQLLHAAEQHALRAGCLTMEISSSRRRVDAHAFYTGRGYRDWSDRAARFIKDLVPGASARFHAARS